ncbi:aminopeptidase II. Metallo peptidase. MEROPS family M29 [Marinitoga hydrogenitolerans DSM 16785]|uniref:Aminopeptidase II. Metallo peptidase. MEROPS family M29 n=1 Tax=Marinitoga hydrogenitolerans (strain DSM 16785 / JCM 12826 / AT1271) TaxID=1122195 RepID=A0A1M5ACD5_MARH1|nr:aminopeptidase [Marinitoga hydrogenitolerans]SHF27804.1 aminopeptidase II. Metallo peptidase. MEROPS family M29 [Marinitoga hydrogenitolerans DSM 16785]
MKKLMEKYAELLVKVGINVQKDQRVFLRSTIDSIEFTRIVAEKAYEAGAKEVYTVYNDEYMLFLKLKYADNELLNEFHQWEVDMAKYFCDEKGAFLSIIGSDPDILKTINPQKIGQYSKTRQTAMKDVSKVIMADKVSWSVGAVPSEKWAKKVFPNSDNPVQELWNAILKTVRVNENEDPVQLWNKHLNNLKEKTKYLNNKQYDYLRYEGPGTDLTVGLPKNHKWLGGAQKNEDGTIFLPNIPTEEVFTAPHKDKVNGYVRNSKPLVYGGNVIDGFTMEFKDGKIVKITAEKGEDILKQAISLDEGASYLGEVALVPVDSPIYQLNVVFYNTLFDENAASHFAFGRAYSTCIENGENMSEEELKAVGLNNSITHVDFMIGNEEMNVYGIKGDNEELIMKNGKWTI